MSLQIIKAGILDTIQDSGRFGFQHLGINSSGAIDKYAFQLSNALLGKPLNSPAIEIHFPASVFLFQKDSIFVITGADFSPSINGKRLPIGQPVAIAKSNTLKFEKVISGARCYLSIIHNLKSDVWLDSASTNLHLGAGGHIGRRFIKNDVIEFTGKLQIGSLQEINNSYKILPWGKQNQTELNNNEIRFMEGNEWEWLTPQSKEALINSLFQISPMSDRMGYRLKSTNLKVIEDQSMLSSAVTFGTMQLLPDGQVIVLMVDHQTTGGYPRIGHVITADLPLLAQKIPSNKFKFIKSNQNVGWSELKNQKIYLENIREICNLKISKLIK